MNLTEARNKLPELAGLDDQSAFDVIHQSYYPQWDKAALAQQLNYTPATSAAPQAGVFRTLGDVGIKLAQGGVGLGSAVVGLGSLVTGGLVGKGMRAIGYDPKATNEALGQYLSNSQKASDAKVHQAEGFVDTVATALANPRSILGSVVESAPGMLAGMGVTGAVARGIATKAALTTAEGAAVSAAELAAGKTATQAAQAALATETGRAAASKALDAVGTRLLGLGAATEGAQSAGRIADDAQAAGRSYADYALPALTAGSLTAGIGLGAGRLMGDAATHLATGARSTAVQGGLLARSGKQALSEGGLEELPQSAQEQYLTNIAHGEKDRMKGVANAAAMGLVTGAAMGAGMGVVQGHRAPSATLPDSGPLSRAVNAANEANETQTEPAPVHEMDFEAVPLPAAQATPPALIPDGGYENGIWFEPPGDLPPAAPAVQPNPEHTGNTIAYESDERLSDDNILTFSNRQPYTLEQAQQVVLIAEAKGHDLTIVPHAGGDGYALMPSRFLSDFRKHQFASLQRAPVLPLVNPEHERDLAKQAELAQLAQRPNAPTYNMYAPTGIGQLAQQERALETQRNQQLQHERVIQEQAQQALTERLIQEQTARQEREQAQLLAAIPERTEPDASTTEEPTNTAAVDAAIAAGMRVRTKNGSILHKKGSSKIFRLNQAQRAYYQQRMAELAASEATEPPVTPPVESPPESTTPPASVTVPAIPATDSTVQEADTATVSPPESNPTAQRQALNRKTVKDMSDAELLQAKALFADSPRAPKIAREINRRGLNQPDSTLAPVERQDNPPQAPAPQAPAPQAPAASDTIATQYAQLLARDGVSATPTEFHHRFAKHVLAKDAYALKWVTNGMNDKAKQAFFKATGVKLPKTQSGAWVALRNWAGISDEHDAAVNAKAQAQREASQQADEEKEIVKRAQKQLFRISAQDDTLISAKEIIDQRIADGFNTIKNISKNRIPRYVLANEARQQAYPLDKIARQYAEVALRRMGELALAQETVNPPAQTPSQTPTETPTRQEGNVAAAPPNNPEGASNPTTETAPASAYGANNKIFSASAAEKARALLRSKLSQLNSGLDPEMLSAGIALAGYHIEAGARTFAAYARAMVADLGEQVRPYLRSFYEGVRHYPHFDTRDMTRPADIDAALGIGFDEGDVIEYRGKIRKVKEVSETWVSFTEGKGDYYSNLRQYGPFKVTKSVQPSATITESASEEGANHDNGHRPIKSPGVPTLGGTSTHHDSATEAGRRTARNDTSGSDPGPRPDSGIDAVPALPGPRSGGSGTEAVHSATAGRDTLRSEAPVGTGTGRRNGRERSPLAGMGGRHGGDRSTQGKGIPGRDVPEAGRNTGAATAGTRERGTTASGTTEQPGIALASSAPASTIPASNFRITADVRLGQGGEVAKFNDNLAAIRTLQSIEAQNRRATLPEQALLARYVGWGGLANAFPAPDSGQFKPDWQQRGPQLQQLLSAKEYAQARRSTLDAHYTSQTVVNAMWSAAQHLGFAGGLALESSVGTGNFIGLLPDSLQGTTRFIGVELDSLTARIAQALYPQETILNSGLQKVPLADGAFDLAIGNPPFGEQSLRFQYKPGFNGQSIHNQFFLAALEAVKPGGLLVQVVSRYLLDRKDSSAREMLAKKARLLGAIRLPDSAFKENARTEVVTDILFLQRFTPAEEAHMAQAFAPPSAATGQNARINPMQDDNQEPAATIPDWVTTTLVPDPLGGEGMEINRYFAANPHMIMGVLERSGSMQYKNDITVRLDKTRHLADLLPDAIRHLPHNVAVAGHDAIQASLERHQAMSDNLKMALAGHEAGTIVLEPGNVLTQVVERETPEGGYELSKRTLTPTSPWSERLFQNAAGLWYSVQAVVDEDGKTVKAGQEGKASKRNLYERRVYASEADIPSSLLLGASRHQKLVQLAGIRDVLLAQINLEAENSPDHAIEQNRQSLSNGYQAFTKRHGLINDPANASLVSNMPDGALLLALEFGYRPAVTPTRAARRGEAVRRSSATPAPILSRRVILPYIAPTTAQSLADALSITLAETGQVAMPRIASLLGQTVPELEQALREADKPLAFYDPETSRWETRNDYLSGQVRRKLNAAQQAGLSANIRALEAVQPEPWTAENVSVLLGSTWAPGSVYEDFIRHISGRAAKVSFSPLRNQFHVLAKGDTVKAKEDEWGTDELSSAELIKRLLNNESIHVMQHNSDGQSYIHPEKTALAQLKARAITKEFTDWVFQDSERRTMLVDLFNDKFNTRVNRQYDGSHLMLPGKVPDAVITMRRHQKNAIWRGIYERALLLDHAVGAGKTFTAIAIAMERRRMGLSKKPMIIVPNHMVEQFTADAYRLYPGAKVLAAGRTDFDKARRRRLFAKIATGDADLVIIAHSSFGFIDIAPETEERYLQVELERALKAVEEAQKEAEREAELEGKALFRKPFTVKEAERLVEKITSNLEKVKTRKDRLLTFEQMGIDHLIVDEAHEFKNLFYSSRLKGVRGMGNKLGSQKATDLYNKVRVLRESPTGAVTFMTGTPISNSAVEMYSMMRYLAASDLKELGLEHFDAWRAQYVSAEEGWEPTETGRLKEVVRLGRTWSNMRSLMDLYYSFTDSVDNDAIKRAYAEDNGGAAFPIPRVTGGERQSVVMQPTEAQIALLNGIMSGFDNLPGIEDPYERNKERLRLMDKARKVSLDVRAIEPSNPSTEQGGKLDRVAQEVARLYQKWDADQGTQLIFLDRSVPKSKGDNARLKQYDALLAEQKKALQADNDDALRRVEDKLEAYDAHEMLALRQASTGGWNAYQQIKDNLIARGIPANEIRFIQEATDDAQKKALFDAVNDGAVRVLIGSTPRMGAGTNVQQRLVGLHHVDVTWKPSDIEQREGRIIRQGNLLLEKYGVDQFEVEILAYATERTIDAKMWALNASKLKTINGIRKYDGSFIMEFEDEESVSMAELAALASGDPLLLERVKLMSELDKLELLKKQYQRKEWGFVTRLENAERDIARLPGYIQQAEQDRDWRISKFAALQEHAKARRVVVEGIEYTDRKSAQQAVLAAIEQQQGGNEKAKFSVSVGKRRLTSSDGAMNAVWEAMGDAESFVMEVGDKVGAKVGNKVVISRTDAARAMAPQINQMAQGLEKHDDANLQVGRFLDLPVEATLQYGEYNYFASLALVREDGSTLVSTGVDARKTADFTTQVVRSALDKLVQQAANLGSEANIAHMQRRLAQARQELPELQAKVGKPFPEQAQIDAKYQRLEQVVNELSTGKHAALVNELDPTAPPSVLGRVGRVGRTSNNLGATLDHALFAAVLQGSSAQDLLSQIAQGSKDEFNRTLANHLLASGVNPEVAFSSRRAQNRANPNEDYLASFYPSSNRVVLHEMPGAESNLLHEMMHAATHHAISTPGAARARMQGLFQAVQRSGKLDQHYGMSNLDEFVAEAFSNPAFQRELASINTLDEHGNLWQRFVALIRRILGLAPREQNALSAAIEAGFQLMEHNRQLTNSSQPSSAPEASALPKRLGPALREAANQIQDVRLPAGFLVSDLLNQSGKLSWWHKTIGTMDNLARRHPAFAPVYQAAQDFLGDVSRFAVLAADQAPTLLPTLENLRDVWGSQRKKPLTAQDTQAISAPIFEGTLIWARDEMGNPVKLEALEQRAKLMSAQEKAMILLQTQAITPQQNRTWQAQGDEAYATVIDSQYASAQLQPGVVWTDDELRQIFQLTDAQIGLVREFRAAIDQSLSQLTISEMVKLGGKDAKDLMQAAINTGNIEEATTMLIDHFMELVQTAPADPANQAKAMQHLHTAQQITNLAGRGLDLIRRGYAPLSRFGRYSVYVQQEGEQLYFGLFESGAEAAKMARTMRRDYPDAQVLHGSMSDEAYKMFAGISPETIELFGGMVGLDTQADAASSAVYQAYLQLTKSNRSALKRLIERKGIAGFSQDAGRVLAGFIYSNARLTAANAHLGEMDEAIAAIPKQQGQLIDAAMQLRQQIQNPERSGNLLGGLMFAQFLGGSVASAMVNLTQPLTMTLPFLSQFGGARQASQRLLEAVRLAAKSQTDDNELDAALKWASDEGIVAPQEVHYLQDQAAGKGVLQSGDGSKAGNARASLNNALSKVMVGWGKLFAMAELSNRRITFIAAWRTAVAQGMADPAQFARDAVAQTQGVYNSGNKPRWARSSLGGLLMTFKQYSIAWVELLARMAFAGKPGSAERAAGRRGALLMLAVLFLMSGLDGLPFEKNLEDVIDGILQRMGYNFSSKRQKQAFLTEVLGEGGADFALKGMSSIPGMPIDVASRLGMGNLIPATGLLTKKVSYTRDLGELAGPAGDLAKRAFTGTGKLLRGEVADAALEVSPQAIRNLAKGVDMLASGQFRDARGYQINQVTPLEALMKMIGFQPNSTAAIQDAKGQALNMMAQNRMRSIEIQEHLAQGIVNGDVAMQRQARAWRDDWNQKNPETPIAINMPAVVKRVRAMRAEATLRTQQTAPKALKQVVRHELGDVRH